jgi:hypothetical protein
MHTVLRGLAFGHLQKQQSYGVACLRAAAWLDNVESHT